MTKTIDTLIDDIEKVFLEHHEFDTETLSSFGRDLSATVASRINETARGGTLRFSNLGTSCKRKLWYSVNEPEKGEALPFETRVKFLFGDILESKLLWLAKEAGHSVEYQQHEVEIDDVKGHIDAVIDGVLIDVKSASTMSFNKFKNGLTPEQDSFGYLTQLNLYFYAAKKAGLLKDVTKFAFLVIDKTLGKICLDVHEPEDIDYEELVKSNKNVVTSRKLPSRGYFDVPDGKSGNRKLDTVCSYCNFRSSCWPSLRTFLYSSGPRFLTNVERLPDVPEVIKE